MTRVDKHDFLLRTASIHSHPQTTTTTTQLWSESRQLQIILLLE